ncbi:MAG: DNA polymerase IV [Chloroflexi bacterium]|nr:MAG: DNA polymerase IV [Chloroflexota bacterium]
MTAQVYNRRMVRKILHLDLDAFYCAVEMLYDESLTDAVFVVGGAGARGVVASASYRAREYGIRSAMPMSTALRLYPDLVIVGRSDGRYSEKSREVMRVLHDLTPYVEKISIDEAFLDVTLLPDDGAAIAARLQKRINDTFKLPCSLGVATNKLVAKIANNIGKAKAGTGEPPNWIEVVPPGEEAAFLAPLPIRELWGVGPKTAEKLAALGVKTIGDITRWPEAVLDQQFGKHGRDLYRHARGIDERPVNTERETKSISKEITFDTDRTDGVEMRRVLRRLSDGVGRQVRKSKLKGRTVSIKLRWQDFTTLTRQITLDHPTDSDNEIYHAAERLFMQNWPPGKPVRLIGVGISGFDEGQRQLGLWDDVRTIEEDQRLQDTLDDLRDRFGDGTIKRGSDLRREP